MTRTLRERLAARDTFVVGQFVRVSNPNSGMVGMTGTVAGVDHTTVVVRMTSWGMTVEFPRSDVTPVKTGEPT